MGFKFYMTALIGALCLIMTAGFSIHHGTVINNNIQPLSIVEHYDVNGHSISTNSLNASLEPLQLPYDVKPNGTDDLNGFYTYKEFNIKNLDKDINPLINNSEQQLLKKKMGRRSINRRKRRFADDTHNSENHCANLRKFNDMCDLAYDEIENINDKGKFDRSTLVKNIITQFKIAAEPIRASLNNTKNCSLYKSCKDMELPVFDLVKLYYRLHSILDKKYYLNEHSERMSDNINEFFDPIKSILHAIFLHMNKCANDSSFDYPGVRTNQDGYKNLLCKAEVNNKVWTIRPECQSHNAYRRYMNINNTDIFRFYELPEYIKWQKNSTKELQNVILGFINNASGQSQASSEIEHCCVYESCPGIRILISEAAKKLIYSESNNGEISYGLYYWLYAYSSVSGSNGFFWKKTLITILEEMDKCFQKKKLIEYQKKIKTPQTISEPVNPNDANRKKTLSQQHSDEIVVSPTRKADITTSTKPSVSENNTNQNEYQDGASITDQTNTTTFKGSNNGIGTNNKLNDISSTSGNQNNDGNQFQQSNNKGDVKTIAETTDSASRTYKDTGVPNNPDVDDKDNKNSDQARESSGVVDPNNIGESSPLSEVDLSKTKQQNGDNEKMQQPSHGTVVTSTKNTDNSTSSKSNASEIISNQNERGDGTQITEHSNGLIIDLNNPNLQGSNITNTGDLIERSVGTNDSKILSKSGDINPSVSDDQTVNSASYRLSDSKVYSCVLTLILFLPNIISYILS